VEAKFEEFSGTTTRQRTKNIEKSKRVVNE